MPSFVIQLRTFVEQDKTKEIDFFSENLRNRAAEELSQLTLASHVHTYRALISLAAEGRTVDLR